MVDYKRLVGFLEKPHSRAEIAKHFMVGGDQVESILKRECNGHKLITLYNDAGDIFYRYYPPHAQLEVAERIWNHVISVDERVPYQVINFPKGKWTQILIIPFFDIQWGSSGHDTKKFDDYIDFIAKTENAFAFLGGDTLQNSLPNSPGGSVFDQIMRPHMQIISIEKKLQPIAHKILWALKGNHEDRTTKLTDLDPLFFVARSLGIPYYDQPCYVDINWRDKIFRFFAQHGTSGAATPGGRVNSAIRPLIFTEFTHFYVMGHVNDVFANPVIRTCRERIYEEKNGKKILKEIRLVDRLQYIIIAPSFELYHGTYAARAALPPFATGDVSCRINADGSYEVTG